MQFAGPGYVVRKWPLNAISICRYGIDRNTNTEFSQTETDTVSVSISTPSTENDEVTKSTGTAPAAGATAPATGAENQQFAQNPGQAGGISIEMLKQFSAEFGPKGTEYLTAGLTLDAARYQFAVHERDAAREELKQFGEKLKAKDTEIDSLKAQLKQFGANVLGQETPVNTDGDAGKSPAVPEAVKQFANVTSQGRAAFAAGLKIRGQQ